jgi:hypothetical protein
VSTIVSTEGTIFAVSRARLAWILPVAVAASCAPPPRMCAQESDCGAQASCVAGRCVVHGATAAIDNARRMLVEPADVGWVHQGDATGTPAVALMGRAGDPGIAFLRFELPLRPEVKVVEAYLLLERASNIDTDPGAIALHAARVISHWDSRSLTWAHQPAIEEVGSPVTLVTASAGPLVRIDVKDIVQRWRRRDRDELGVALLAEGQSVTGVAVALGTTDVEGSRVDPVLASRFTPPAQAFSPFEPRPAPATPELRRQIAGPRLEVYAR